MHSQIQLCKAEECLSQLLLNLSKSVTDNYICWFVRNRNGPYWWGMVKIVLWCVLSVFQFLLVYLDGGLAMEPEWKKQIRKWQLWNWNGHMRVMILRKEFLVMWFGLDPDGVHWTWEHAVSWLHAVSYLDVISLQLWPLESHLLTSCGVFHSCVTEWCWEIWGMRKSL